jgi:regulator of replication initiation timing
MKKYINEKDLGYVMDFKEQVKQSFSACKNDILQLFDENAQLKEQVSSLSSQNTQLHSDLQEMKSLLSQLTEQISDLQNQISQQTTQSTNAPPLQPTQPHYSTSQSPSPQSPPPNFAPSPTLTSTSAPNSVASPVPRMDPYEALLAFKAKKNKREMLKQKMISMITDEGMILSELKFMFVDHFRYCSKATFYNYLKELEHEKEIVIQRKHSKNMVFLPGLRKHI